MQRKLEFLLSRSEFGCLSHSYTLGDLMNSEAKPATDLKSLIDRLNACKPGETYPLNAAERSLLLGAFRQMGEVRDGLLKMLEGEK
jgi:hypothetical protein